MSVCARGGSSQTTPSGPQRAGAGWQAPLLCLRIDLFLKSSGCRNGLYFRPSVPCECRKWTSLELFEETSLGITRDGVIQPCHPPVQSCRTGEVIPLVMEGPATQGPCILTCGQVEGLTEAGRIYEAGKCWFSDLSRERETHKQAAVLSNTVYCGRQ